MKIEIEFEEVERLKKLIENREDEIKELELKLKSLDEKELKDQATRLAWALYESYLKATFRQLGFNQNSFNGTVRQENLSHWIGENWYDTDKFTVDLHVSITNEFRNVFVNLGVKTKEE